MKKEKIQLNREALEEFHLKLLLLALCVPLGLLGIGLVRLFFGRAVLETMDSEIVVAIGAVAAAMIGLIVWGTFRLIKRFHKK